MDPILHDLKEAWGRELYTSDGQPVCLVRDKMRGGGVDRWLNLFSQAPPMARLLLRLLVEHYDGDLSETELQSILMAAEKLLKDAGVNCPSATPWMSSPRSHID